MRFSSTLSSSFQSGAFALFLGAACVPAAYAESDSSLITGSIRTWNEDASVGKKMRKQLVDANICIAIDASGSIVAEENREMMEGVKEAVRYIARNNDKYYSASIVRYGSWSKLGISHIFRTEAGAEQLIENELSYDPTKNPTEELGLGTHTNIHEAIQQCRLVFQYTESEKGLNIYSMKNALVIIGDGRQSSERKGEQPSLLPEIRDLARKFGVSTYAIPIRDRGGTLSIPWLALQQFYKENLVIPEEEKIHYRNVSVFGDVELTVPPSQLSPAIGFGDVGRATTLAFQGAGL